MPRPSSRSSSTASRGHISTSRERPGVRTTATTSARERRAGESGCWSSSRARSADRSPMDFDLNREQKLIQQTVRDFARAEIAPAAEELDREHRFPYEIVAKLGELGL